MIKSTPAIAAVRRRAASHLLVAIALQIYTLPEAFGCSCPEPPPCQAYSQVTTVFVGTVAEALATNSGRISRARIQVDRTYKGVPQETHILLTDVRACADPELRVGEQYLIYSDVLESGEVASAGCSRSRTLRYAQEDLKYLDNLREAAPTGTIFGTVVRRDGNPGDLPAAGALVEVRGLEKTKVITTDGEGRYQFDGLAPATYSLTVSQPGFRPSSESDGAPAVVSARGCTVVTLAVRQDWPGAIEGQLIPSEDTPPPSDIGVSLLPIQAQDDGDLSHLFRAQAKTNAKGEYSFRGVPPGLYRVAMNLYQIPTPEVPYPAIYWPSSDTEEAAAPVEVGWSSVSRRCDFRLPPRLKTAVVKGVLIRSAGEVGEQAWIAIFKQPDNAIVDQVPVTDAAGNFSFTALEGFEYNLLALQGEKRSKEVPFSVGKGPQVVRVVLDDPQDNRQ